MFLPFLIHKWQPTEKYVHVLDIIWSQYLFILLHELLHQCKVAGQCMDFGLKNKT